MIIFLLILYLGQTRILDPQMLGSADALVEIAMFAELCVEALLIWMFKGGQK